MIVCGIVLVIAVTGWLWGRKRLKAEWNKMLLIVAAGAFAGLGIGYAEDRDDVIADGNRLVRSAAGEGSYEQELTFCVEGTEEEQSFVVIVPEQILTREEEQRYLQAAGEELREAFPGENDSLNEIRGSVNVCDSYQEGKVTAEWQFDDYGLVDSAGNVTAEDLPEEGSLVKATVTLFCGTSLSEEEFYFRVFPPVRGEREALLHEVEELIQTDGEKIGTAFLQLPTQVGSKRLKWGEIKERTAEKVLCFGCVLAMFVPVLERSRQQEEQKKRDRMLEIEFPEVVSKMALLLGAGMTPQAAFRRIAYTYEEKKKQRLCVPMPAYEEMLVACHEMESGMGEGRVYERYGERCKRADYRKFGTILAQNLRKGSQGVILLLEQEAENAFEERKSAAKRYGEEAGTKLLIPMIFMLGIVMALLMIPAVMTFQI